MSCTLMYQPYAMSYSSSSCDRTTSERQKLFKFPHVPSPPDSSSNSAGGSPSSAAGTYAHNSSAHSSSSAAASNFTLPLIPPPGSLTAGVGPGGPFNYHHHNHHHLSLSQHHQAQQQLPLSPHENSPNSQRSSSSSQSRRSITPCATITSASVHNDDHMQHINEGTSRPSDIDLPHTITSGSTSSSHHLHHHHHNQNHTSSGEAQIHSHTSGGGGHHQQQAAATAAARALYLSANCTVYENYDGDAAREVDEHFSKALSVAFGSNGGSGSGSGSGEKSSGKNVPMSTRNFPPSFFNSAYQPPVPSSSSRPLTSYGHSDFYGSAASMDYTGGLQVPGLHHQSDPWHYPLAPHHHHHHQSYHHHHHRAADLAAAAAYTPMPSSSRFNPTQYSSFLFPSPTVASASRFSGIGGSSVGVKGDGGHWGAGGRYHPHHPHESSWSDFHLADYSAAAAAAHYSNITAGSYTY